MLIMTTIDDLPPEGIPYITDKIIDAGAKNVHIINALTKKGRMEYIVLVDFEEEFFDDISSLLALEFGTIGMKIFRHEHKKFPYELIEKILDQMKGNQNERIYFNKGKIEKVLPKNLIKRDKRYIENYIVEAIEFYKKYRSVF